MTLIDQLKSSFPALNWQANEPWAKHNPLGIGGPAEVFIEVKTTTDFQSIATYALEQNIELTVLGWGANTLIADRGLAGLVIKNSVNNIAIEPQPDHVWTEKPIFLPHRYTNSTDSFGQLDYDESNQPDIRVDVAAGTPLPYAINHLINQDITGLQWFARIPATIGGAIFNNIHGGTHFMSEYLVGVTCLTPQAQITTYLPSQLEFEYDSSRFHHSQETILIGHFSLKKGDTVKAQKTADEWAIKKSTQPARSLGCVFQNLLPDDQERLQLPTPSVAFLIEHKLKLKGYQIGDCQISMAHAAFIENVGHATAQDYLQLIRFIIDRAKNEFNLTLKPEIFFKGFTKTELSGII